MCVNVISDLLATARPRLNRGVPFSSSLLGVGEGILEVEAGAPPAWLALLRLDPPFRCSCLELCLFVVLILSLRPADTDSDANGGDQRVMGQMKKWRCHGRCSRAGRPGTSSGISGTSRIT